MIPVNEPRLDGNEKRYLAECIDTGWISSDGPFVGRLEHNFASMVNRAHAIAVANGSAALDIAVAALDLGPGDEVILPTFTIISCAAAVVRAGATPVLVDCDPNTWNMRPEDVLARITSRTKAILAVHIYGLPVDMDPILNAAAERGIAVIEDAAELHGASYYGRPCGSLGQISTFSFYPNKHITTGEGGMVVTDDPALAERCRSLRNLCFQPARRFVHEELGWNYRMSNLQAAVGVAQLERLSDSIRRKREIGARYRELLQDLPGISFQPAKTPFADNIYWVMGLVLGDDILFDAAEAMSRLAKRGIGTRPFFWPMHEQPVFKKRGWFTEDRHPISERIARRGFYLPSGLALKDAEIEVAAAALRDILK